MTTFFLSAKQITEWYGCRIGRGPKLAGVFFDACIMKEGNKCASFTVNGVMPDNWNGTIPTNKPALSVNVMPESAKMTVAQVLAEVLYHITVLDSMNPDWLKLGVHPGFDVRNFTERLMYTLNAAVLSPHFQDFKEIDWFNRTFYTLLDPKPDMLLEKTPALIEDFILGPESKLCMATVKRAGDFTCHREDVSGYYTTVRFDIDEHINVENGLHDVLFSWTLPHARHSITPNRIKLFVRPCLPAMNAAAIYLHAIGNAPGALARHLTQMFTEVPFPRLKHERRLCTVLR